jgi:hypothetical protein
MQMFVVSIALGKDKMIAARVEDQQQLATRAFLASIRWSLAHRGFRCGGESITARALHFGDRPPTQPRKKIIFEALYNALSVTWNLIR